MHVNPPVALGSGCRGLADKAKALAIGWALQVPGGEAELRKHAESYQSHTSDMGVELSLPDFAVQSIETLLPTLCNRSSLSADVDVLCASLAIT